MSLTNVFGKDQSAGLYDQAFGAEYDVVRRVHDSIDKIDLLAQYIDGLTQNGDIIVDGSNLTREWRYVVDNFTGLETTVNGHSIAIAGLGSQLGSLGALVGNISDSVNSNAAGIAAEVVARAAADTALASQIAALSTRVGSTEAGLVSETTIRETAVSSLYQAITTITARVAGSEAAIVAEQQARADAISAEAAARTLLGTRIGNAEAAITAEENARSTADSALASQISTVETRVGSAEAAIVAEQEARATAIAAEAAARTQLAATVGNKNSVFVQPLAPTNAAQNDIWIDSDSGNRIYVREGSQWVERDDARIEGVLASISGEQLARAAGDAALASEITQLLARVIDTEDGISIASAQIINEASTRALEDQALATSLSTLQARVTNTEDDISSVAASVQAEQTARVAQDNALANRLTSVEAAVGGGVGDLSSFVNQAETAAVNAANSAAEAESSETVAANAATAAGSSATAAGQSATNAAASATASAQSATASQNSRLAAESAQSGAQAAASAASVSQSAAATSASNAAGSASSATTSQNLAASYASDAQNSASAAASSAGTASAQASIATTQAANASSSAASASASAVLAASLSTGLLNQNATFADWPNPLVFPTGWFWWNGNGITLTRDSSRGGANPYTLYAQCGAVENGIMQNRDSADGLRDLGAGYYVLETDFIRGGGDLRGGGIYIQWFNHLNVNIGSHTRTFVDMAGGNAMPDGLVSDADLMQAPAGTTNAILYLLFNWQGISSTFYAKDLYMRKVGIRRATNQEIAAGVALPAVQASVSQLQGAVAGVEGSAAFLEQVVAASGSTPALMRMKAGKNGSSVGLLADRISLANQIDGIVREALVVENGAATFTGQLRAGSVTTDEIATKAITTSKLAIIPNNLNPDPLFQDEQYWLTQGVVDAGGWYFENAPGSPSANALGYHKYMALWDGTGTVGTARRHVYGPAIPFSYINEPLRIRADVVNFSNQHVWVFFEWLSAAGGYLGGTYPQVLAGSGLVRLNHIQPLPAGVAFVRVGFCNDAPGSNFQGGITITNLRLDLATGANLIVDGAITAQKLNVGSLSAISANVGELTAGVLRSPSNSARLDLGAGRITFNNGTIMKVTGNGFGSSNQFLEWAGPSQASLSTCTEANAIQFLKTNGDAYFGGVLSAGILKNAARTTQTASNASVSTGSFGSNGGARTVVVSYQWRRHVEISGACNGTGTPSVTIRLRRNGVQVAQWNATGSVSCANGLGPAEPGLWQEEVDASWTFTDNSGGSSVEFTAEIFSRTLATVPISQMTTTVLTQTLGIVSTE